VHNHKLESCFFWASAISYVFIVAMLLYGSLTYKLPQRKEVNNYNVATK
jgi:hypothetical protein